MYLCSIDKKNKCLLQIAEDSIFEVAYVVTIRLTA